MHGRWEVSDEQWALWEPILRSKRRPEGKGRPPKDPRAVLNGVWWILGTGAQGREMPEQYPPYQTCHRRLQQWVRAGALAKALRKLAQRLQVFRRLVTRYEYHIENFLGMVRLRCMKIMLRYF